MTFIKYVISLLLSLNIAVAQAPVEPATLTSQNLEILGVVKTPTEEKINTPESLEESISRLSQKYSVQKSLASAIIQCESSSYAHATGTKAVIGIDIGYWQINTYYHEESARKMGLDIYNPQDNLEYGFWLLSTQGSHHWNASKGCWISLI